MRALLLLAALAAPALADAPLAYAFRSEVDGVAWVWDNGDGFPIRCKGVAAGSIEAGTLQFAFHHRPLVPNPFYLVFYPCAWYAGPKAVATAALPVAPTEEGGFAGDRALVDGHEAVRIGPVPGPATFHYSLAAACADRTCWTNVTGVVHATPIG